MREQVRDRLITGDEQQCRRIVFNLYLAGQSACEICDRVLTLAFHDIGNRWKCGELTIYRERRACVISLKLLHELRMAVRTPLPEAPVAIGGSLSCDPYRLPNSRIELVLRELGWQATSLGTSLPTATIGEAVRDSRLRLLWLSVSYIESVPTLLAEHAHLHRIATDTGAAVVVGGRALTAEIRQQMAYSAYARELLRLHQATYPRNWRWSQAAVDHAMLRGYLWTVFGWRVQVGAESNPRSLANFPMQANGAEMLRLACCLATERGISVCCPIHDALLIEADADEIETAAAATQAAMLEASRVVLNGFELRTDAKIVRYPDRYSDPRGERLWEIVMAIVAELGQAEAVEDRVTF